MKRDPREFIKEGNRRRLEIHIKNDSCRALLQFKDAIKLLLVAWRPDDSTTSCKNVETLSWKKRPFLLQIAPDHRSVRYNILTSLLPPIQTCSSMFWVWSCIASNFDKGWRENHKHKIMGRLFMPKYVLEQCLKYFCNWLSHLRFTSKSDFHALNSQNEDYSDINK